MNLKVIFLGTPDFVGPPREALKKNYILVEDLKEAELLIVAAYGKILTSKELNTPKYGGLNIHPSLLPKYRGPSPIQQTILNGDHESGVTIIKMDEEIDHGPILAQERMEVLASDTFFSVSEKAFKLGAEVLIQIIPKYVSGRIKPRAQNHKLASFCMRIKKQDGYFDIDNPPDKQTLDRMIRAYFPWPSAWTRWKGKIVKIYPDRFVQMEGKNKTKLENFLLGYPDFPLKII